MFIVKSFLLDEPQLKLERNLLNEAIGGKLDFVTDKLSKYNLSELCNPQSNLLNDLIHEPSDELEVIKAFGIYLAELAILTSGGSFWKEHPVNLVCSIMQKRYQCDEKVLAGLLMEGNAIEYLNVFIPVATAKQKIDLSYD